jgi:hypothetical protein
MSTYEDLLGHHLCSALDLVASMPASEYLDSTKTPGMELCAITSCCYDSTNQRPHMHPSYYYFGAPNSNSADDNYNPTCECFQIYGVIASDSEAEATTGGGGMPHHPTQPTLVHRVDPNLSKQTREHNSFRFKNYRPSSTRSKNTCAYFSKPSSGSMQRVYMAEELKRELTTLIVASLRIGWANPRSSTKPARTSSPPPCFSATCPNHLPLRPVGPVMRFEVSSRLWPCSRPRILP